MLKVQRTYAATNMTTILLTDYPDLYYGTSLAPEEGHGHIFHPFNENTAYLVILGDGITESVQDGYNTCVDYCGFHAF
jgi:hypothetical protein